jgi:hypothetical protein
MCHNRLTDSFDGAQEVNRRRLVHSAHYRAGKISARKWFLPLLNTLKKHAVAAKGNSERIVSALQVVFDAMNVMLSTFLMLKMLVQTWD